MRSVRATLGLVLVVACGSDGDDTGGTDTVPTGSMTFSTDETSATVETSATFETSATSATVTGTTSGSTASASTSTGTETATGTGAGGCLAQAEHLLVSEVMTQPGAGEFVELYNPGATAVDLSIYYLSDNGAAYHGLAAGAAWDPEGTPDTDFLVGFPPDSSISGGEHQTIELGNDFEGQLGECPTYTVRDDVMCDGVPVPKVSIPTGGGLGTSPAGLLSNAGEMVVLFCFDGDAVVYDVDYLTWDPDSDDPNTRVDKTGVPGYADDTAAPLQSPAPVPGADESIGRCDDSEPDETSVGGNGLFGHDETSENLALSFVVLDAPSPGAANTCP